jgi:precorrin-2 methylase
VGVIRVVGLGPGDPDLLTLGSLEALRRVGRAVLLLAPPELALFVQSEGVTLLNALVEDAGLFVRGSTDTIERFVEKAGTADLALGVLGNPLSDFPGLPILLRALEARGLACELVPGMPRATLSASVAMPLLRFGRDHGAAAPFVPVGSRANARVAGQVSHRRGVRSRGRDRDAS